MMCNSGLSLKMYSFHICVNTVCVHPPEGSVCVCVLCVRGSFAVGSLSQPLPHRSPLAPLPLTSHLPHGLPPADPHPASSSSSLFCPFSFIFFPVASCNHDIKVRSLSDRNSHLRELRRICLYLLVVSASGVK